MFKSIRELIEEAVANGKYVPPKPAELMTKEDWEKEFSKTKEELEAEAEAEMLAEETAREEELLKDEEELINEEGVASDIEDPF